MKVYLIQGFIIGFIGTFLGLLGGVIFSLNIENIILFFERIFNFTVLAPDVYFISDLPAELKILDLVHICTMSLLLAIISTLYPAWRGLMTMPAEVLRYEK